jgi:hypothetical protein
VTKYVAMRCFDKDCPNEHREIEGARFCVPDFEWSPSATQPVMPGTGFFNHLAEQAGKAAHAFDALGEQLKWAANNSGRMHPMTDMIDVLEVKLNDFDTLDLLYHASIDRQKFDEEADRVWRMNAASRFLKRGEPIAAETAHIGTEYGKWMRNTDVTYDRNGSHNFDFDLLVGDEGNRLHVETEYDSGKQCYIVQNLSLRNKKDPQWGQQQKCGQLPGEVFWTSAHTTLTTEDDEQRYQRLLGIMRESIRKTEDYTLLWGDCPP